jgi:hypothetical protein
MRDLPLCKITVTVTADASAVSDSINKSLDAYMSILPHLFPATDKRVIRNFLYFWASSMYENHNKNECQFTEHASWEEYYTTTTLPRYKIYAQLILQKQA